MRASSIFVHRLYAATALAGLVVACGSSAADRAAATTSNSITAPGKEAVSTACTNDKAAVASLQAELDQLQLTCAKEGGPSKLECQRSVTALESTLAAANNAERTACAPPLPPPPPPVTGWLEPTYQVLGVIYAPPGNAASAAYSATSGISSTVGVQSAFQEGVQVHAAVGVGALGNNAGVEFGIGVSTGQVNSTTMQTSVNESTGWNVKSSADGIHAQDDVVILALNPRVDITFTPSNDTDTVFYDLGTANNPNFNVIYLQVQDIVNVLHGAVACAGQDAGVCEPSQILADLGRLTKQDLENILSLDPVYSGSAPSMQPARFAPTATRVEVKGPAQGAMGSAGPTFGIDSTVSNGTGSSWSVGVNTSVGVYSELSLFASAKLSVDATFQYTYGNQKSTSMSEKSSATATLSTNTPNYFGVFDIYTDTAFDTFAFEAHPATAAESTQSIQGVVLGASGQPVAGQEVDALQSDGSKYVTSSAADGTYSITYALPGATTLTVPAMGMVANVIVQQGVNMQETLRETP